MAYDGRIRIDTSIDSKGFNTGVSSMVAGSKKLLAILGIAFSIKAAFDFGKTAVSAAADLSSAMVGLQSIVEGTGNSFSQAKGFINDYIKDGLVPITNATTAYKNLLMRGYDTSQIEKVLVALKNSAAFGRQASLTLGMAVQSATEGLKNENSILVDNSGVTKNVTMMWKDYAASIGTTVGSLTKQQKIQAEVNGITEETRFQMNDAAKLSGAYAGQVAALGVSFYNLKVAIGNSIIPIISAVMPAIKKAVDWLVIFFNKVAQFMSVLFNVQISGAIDSINGLADSTNDAADAQENLADATKEAGKAAKGALAPFDELNVLQMETSDSTSSNAATTDVAGVGAIGDITDSMTEIDPKIKESAEKIRAWFVDAWTWVKQAAIDTWDWIKQAGIDTWNWLVTAWGNIGTFFTDLWEGIKTGASTAWEWILSVWNPIAEWFSTNVIAPISESFSRFVDALKEFANVIYEGFIKPVVDWFMVNLWPIIKKVFSWIGDFIKSELSVLGDLWKKFADWMVNLFSVSWEWLKNVFKNVWDLIVSIFKNVWVMFSGVVSGIIDTFTGIITFLTGVFTGNWKKAWEGIKQIFEGIWNVVASISKGVINTIIDLINAMIRGIVSGVNAAINALNSIHINIPDWIPGVGGRSWGISIGQVNAPQIPRLATGAVIPANAPFAAVLGDQKSGTNIEAPESLIRKIIQEEMGSQTPQRVTIDFGNSSLSTLIRTLNPVIKQENDRRGTSLLDGVS